MREIYGYSDISNIPVRGEKLICLKNNHKEGLVNGYTFFAQRNARNWDREKESFDLMIDGKTYPVWEGDILGIDPKEYNFFSNLERVDYGYAITCHKSQGSEYDSVIIIDESWGKDKYKWLYTAVTRAKKKVILAYR